MRSTYPNSFALSRPDRAGSSGTTRESTASLTAENRYARWHVPPPASSGSESWLLSYLDLITLLLSILVVMLAVSRAPTHGQGLEKVDAQAASHPVILVGSLALEGFATAKAPILKFGPAGSFAHDADSATTVQSGVVDDAQFAPADTNPSLLNVRVAPHGADMVSAGDAHASAGTPHAENTLTSRSVTPRAPLPSAKDLGLDDLGKSVAVIINEQSVSFRISDDLLFASGQATLSDAGRDVLRRLAAVLNRNDYPVSVEGHSDAVGIRNKQFSSNWELSTGRATSVLRQLARDGVKPKRLRAIGYAQTRPLESNDTPQGRAANRRVELIMEIKPPREADKRETGS